MPNPQLEIIDTTPVSIPTRLRLPQSRTDQMRQFIREEMSRAAAFQGHETFEEADDIEPDDEESMPLTRYEAMLLEPTNPLQNGVSAEGAAPVNPAPTPEVPSSPTPQASDGTK